MFFNRCTRCGDASLEHLSTHSHCYNCNYSPEIYESEQEQKIPKPIHREISKFEIDQLVFNKFDPNIEHRRTL